MSSIPQLFLFSFFLLHLLKSSHSDVPDLSCEATQIDTLYLYRDSQGGPRTFISSGPYYWDIPNTETPSYYNAKRIKSLNYDEMSRINVVTWFDRKTSLTNSFHIKFYQNICAPGNMTTLYIQVRICLFCNKNYTLYLLANFILKCKNRKGSYQGKTIHSHSYSVIDQTSFSELRKLLPAEMDTFMVQKVPAFSEIHVEDKGPVTHTYSDVVYLSTGKYCQIYFADFYKISSGGKTLHLYRCHTERSHWHFKSYWEERVGPFEMYDIVQVPLWTMFQFDGLCYIGENNTECKCQYIYICPCLVPNDGSPYNYVFKKVSLICF